MCLCAQAPCLALLWWRFIFFPCAPCDRHSLCVLPTYSPFVWCVVCPMCLWFAHVRPGVLGEGDWPCSPPRHSAT